MWKKLTERMLGLDSTSWEAGQTWSLDFQSLPSGDAVVYTGLIGLAVLAAVVWIYRWETRRLKPGVPLLLTLLRILAISGVVLMLFQPVLVFNRKEYIPSRLPVLLDTSRSMGTGWKSFANERGWIWRSGFVPRIFSKPYL
jgi:hypothetical protein